MKLALWLLRLSTAFGRNQINRGDAEIVEQSGSAIRSLVSCRCENNNYHPQ